MYRNNNNKYLWPKSINTYVQNYEINSIHFNSTIIGKMLTMMKQILLNGFNSFAYSVTQLYAAYPSIAKPQEVCAYYRSQNRKFQTFFLHFTLGILFVYVISVFILICEEVSSSQLIASISEMVAVMAILFVLSTSILHTQMCVTKEQRSNLRLQTGIRTRFMAFNGFLTLLTIFGPLSAVSCDNMAESAGIAWLFYSMIEINLAAWSIGGVVYKLAIFAVFNVGYCSIAIHMGYFRELLMMRIMLPIIMSAVYIVALDKYKKENFLLRRVVKQQRNMYQNFFEQIQDPVLILNRSGLVFRNLAAASQLGISQANCFARLRELVTSRGWSLEDHVKVRLDDEYPISPAVQQDCYYLNAAPGNGTARASSSGVLSTDTTASRRKRVIKAALTESAEGNSSKKTVSLVLHEITEELIKEEKEAEGKYKNMLMLSLSHELNTPLNIFQRLLSESKRIVCADCSLQPLFMEAKGAWRYLRNKIRDIMDYVQILSNEFALHNTSFSTAKFLEYMRKVASFLTTGKCQSVVLDFCFDRTAPESLYADKDRLEQVLFNLISNAAKFTERGRIALHISRPEEQLDDNRIHFEVSDTGCGMSKETVAGLFMLCPGASCSSGETMETTQIQTHRRAARLSGLGLTVSQMICSKMGSDITVVSVPDKGSIFAFQIPVLSPPVDLGERNRRISQCLELASVPEPEQESSRSIIPSELLSSQRDRTATVCRGAIQTMSGIKCQSSPGTTYAKPRSRVALVADDNEFNRYVAQQMLHKFGFRTVPAENGMAAVTALRKLQREGYERVLVLMDLDMPVMDGIEATVRIRAEGMLPRPVIVALTAFSAETERKKCFEAGMDQFIDKPLTKERLGEVLAGVGL